MLNSPAPDMMGGLGPLSGVDAPPQPYIDPAIQAAIQEQEQLQAQKVAAEQVQIRKQALHQYLKNWLAKSMMNRRAHFEPKWERWRRNSKSIYDPAKLSRKESWQNRLFVPLSLQTKEIIKAGLHRTLLSELPYSIRPRPSGNIDEAMDIKTLLLREAERSSFESSSNDTFDDVCTYGTGHLKMYWKKKMQMRRVRKPVPEPLTPDVLYRMQQGIPPQITGYQSVLEQRMIYNGLKTEFVSIWDLFFADGAKTVRNAPCMQRTRLSYQEILDGVQEGWALPECVPFLQDVWEPPPSPGTPGQQVAFPDIKSQELQVPRTQNEKEHTVYEAWMYLPMQWVYIRPDEQGLITDPNRIVPAKVLFTAETLVAVDENPNYDGDNDFLSAQYIHNPGSVYGMGPLEMIEQLQEHINEDVNQRKDNEQLVWNRMFAILESAIVSKADLVSRPGGGIRIKRNSTDDVRKAIMWMQTPDTNPSAWEEPMRAEGYAQEVTGINRVTIGSGGSQAKDVTQTKGGMQILQQTANERLTYYAMLIEASYVMDAMKKIYAKIYDNIDPQTLAKVIGPARAQTFLLRTPEDIEQDYFFTPEGVFSTIHQPIRIAQWQGLRDQYAGQLFFNDVEMAQLLAKAVELPNPEKVIVPLRGPDGLPVPFEMIQQAMVMGGNPIAPGKVGAPGTTPQIPTAKAGRNGQKELK